MCLQPLFLGLGAPQWCGSHGRFGYPQAQLPTGSIPRKFGVFHGVQPTLGTSPAAPLCAGHHRSPAPLHRRPHRHLRVRPHGRGHHCFGFGGKVSVNLPTACGGMFPNLVAEKQNQREERPFFFLWSNSKRSKVILNLCLLAGFDAVLLFCI